MRRSLILVVLALALACFSDGIRAADSAKPLASEDTKRALQEEDAKEALFRYQIASNEVSKAEVFFLSVGSGVKGKMIFDSSRDPADAFMNRFTDLKVTLKKASACDFGSPEGWISDKKTKKRGVLLQATSIKWVSDSEVEIAGGFAAGMTYARGCVYSLQREGTKWIVKKVQEKWMASTPDSNSGSPVTG